jgi:cell wall-associated NlpC family hydrolase
MTRDDILITARTEIGTPFRHQGRTPKWALDCAGLVCHVACALGLEYFDQQGYSKRPSGGLLEAALDGQPCLERVAIDAMQPGDVLLMRFDGDHQHLAIYAGWSDVYQGEGIIHAWLQAKKVAENIMTDEWRSRIVRAYRFRGVE